jgi:tetratricopeptide (TPR) repeat protein
VLAHRLAINIQSLAEQLDTAVHVAEIRLLWEESTELLRKLHGCDPRQYDVKFSRALYHLGTHLCRAGYWDRAERPLREARRLYRGLYDGDSASESNCAGLASTLLEYAKSLEKLERNDEAQRTTREAIALRRRLFETRYGAAATQIPAAVRSYGDFLFGLGTWF